MHSAYAVHHLPYSRIKGCVTVNQSNQTDDGVFTIHAMNGLFACQSTPCRSDKCDAALRALHDANLAAGEFGPVWMEATDELVEGDGSYSLRR